MTARDLATIAAKLVGVYILLVTVPKVPTTWLSLTRMRERGVFYSAVDGYAVVIVLELVVFLGAGVAFFVGARRWSAWLFPEAPEAPLTSPVLADRLEIVALSVAGVVILAGVLPKLMSATYGWAMLARAGRNDPAVEMVFGPGVSPAAIIELVSTVAVGLWLALRAHGLANVVRRFRNGGWPDGRTPGEEPR